MDRSDRLINALNQATAEEQKKKKASKKNSKKVQEGIEEEGC